MDPAPPSAGISCAIIQAPPHRPGRVHKIATTPQQCVKISLLRLASQQRKTLHEGGAADLLTALNKYARVGYVASGFALVLGIYLQLYLAVSAVTVQFGSWSAHRIVGHALGAPVVLMVLCAFLGKLDRKMLVLSVVTFGLYGLQTALMATAPRFGLQGLTALHGVVGLALYTLAHKLAIDAFRLVRGREVAV